MKQLLFALRTKIDWRGFVLAVSFGYVLSVFPLMIFWWKGSMEGAMQVSTYVLFRAEVYLIFSIIAFSSVGNLLGNAEIVDLPVVFACALNIVFGVLMFGFFSEFEFLNSKSQSTVENVVQFGKWCWIMSLLIFAGSHLKLRKGDAVVR